MIVLECVHITNNLDKYPECARASRKFPHLVSRVEDEVGTFIVYPNKPLTRWWPANEFFAMTNVTVFTVNEEEL